MKRWFPLLIVVLMLVMSGVACMSSSTQAHQTGIITVNGKVDKVVTSGYQFSLDPRKHIDRIDHSAKTFEWYDPSLVTSDKQPIGLRLTLTVQRSRDTEHDGKGLMDMYINYRDEALKDDALKTQVLGRVPDIAKAATAKFTLDQMLGTVVGDNAGRDKLRTELVTNLTTELAEINVVLLNVNVADIITSPEYDELLKEKANIAIKEDISKKNTALKEEELNQEKAETEKQLEIARRARLIQEEAAKVYETSPEMLQLEMMRLWAHAIERGDVIFVPETGNFTFIFGTSAQPTPSVVPSGQ